MKNLSVENLFINVIHFSYGFADVYLSDTALYN